eukprot:CAMPEP_0114595392 /NCGR_PEP_ID=MMETSP0125-20121206/17176_1 /TAXON_ID=485358 ORGANISM="Aristerostoma sp., Strain ATCC 50986" /NCGR_SAMPLE_ID=MMETSP0125 /ASSEMBLY_ACC=CAM_ASM_000245 /LENGTH=58 /DNA_ID=CAMNT_0001796905 /DNA_START=586 /DNA_END=759 /DNA_ORIENTATION=-
MAESLGMKYVETSAKDGRNCRKVYETLGIDAFEPLKEEHLKTKKPKKPEKKSLMDKIL